MRSRLLMLVVGLGLVACATTEPAGTSGGQARATAESRRAELYPKVSKFLDEAAALEPIVLSPKLEYPTEGELPGWRAKVCPRLTGMPGQEGDFVLARVTEIARSAGARIGAQHCSPNLDIFVTARPKELLKGIEKQNSYEMFGPRWRPYLLDQLTAMPRPVTVWYNIYGGRSVSFKFAFTRVLVVVDQTRLQGVSCDQLADYIAIVGLAEINPDAHLGNAPTILKLFDGAPQVAPVGLSDWDQAFLRSLYSNPSPTPWKRGLARTDSLALSMVYQIVP